MTQPTTSPESLKGEIESMFNYGQNRRKKKANFAEELSREVRTNRPVYQSIDDVALAMTDASGEPVQLAPKDKKTLEKSIIEGNKRSALTYEYTINDTLNVVGPNPEDRPFEPSGALLSEQIKTSRDLESIDRKSIMDKIIDKIRKHTNFNSTLLYIIIALCLLIFGCTCVYKNMSSNFGRTSFGYMNNFGSAVHSFVQ